MAKIKFALKMKEGAEVRTLDQLREHFDLASVLGYYSSGRLYDWLESRGYDEAEKLKALNPSSASFQKDLCEVLRVAYSEPENPDLSLSEIAARNGRLERLKLFTVDDTILAAVDRVAFTQEELDALLSKTDCASTVGSISSSSIGGFTTQTSFLTSTPTKRVIYLCGDRFAVPGNVGQVSYIGINSPEIELPDGTLESGTDFQQVYLDMDRCLGSSENSEKFFRIFEKNRFMGIKFLQVSVADGSAMAQTVLSECYARGFGVKKDAAEAVKWLIKAAEHGDASAQEQLGHRYRYGEGVEENIEEAVKWSLKAAEHGNANAQTRMGILYEHGQGVEKSLQDAVRWYQKAAEQGYSTAQYYLGLCYRDGKGVARDKNEAVQWLKKAYHQRLEAAQTALMEIAPSLFKFSDVILYAIGGEQNLIRGAQIDPTRGTIDIPVADRDKIKDAVLYNFGAENVQINTVYFVYDKPEDAIQEYGKKYGKRVAVEAAKVLLGGIPGIPFAAYGAYKVAKDVAKDGADGIMRKDYGWGMVHIVMDVTSDMEDDFNRHVQSQAKKDFLDCAK